MIRPRNDRDPIDDVGLDPVLAESLALLDPASADPNYWLRFRSWVMSGATRELARRRLMTPLTVGDVMQSWARTLVPGAMLAALLAGMLLLRSGSLTSSQPIGVEELLVSDVGEETIPVLSEADEESAAVAFASEIF